MNEDNKKRDIKARAKIGGKEKDIPGTVNFTFDPNKKKTKPGQKTGEKRAYVPKKRFADQAGYANRDGHGEKSREKEGKGEDKTHS